MNFEKDKLMNYFWLLISILSGLMVGIMITGLCVEYNLVIFGVNIDIFVAPIVAGFIETFISNYTRKKSSGAISAIILFFITNGIGWLFPSTPISFNIFTVGGFILMLQSAFPVIMNYLFIAAFMLFTYILGLGGSVIGFFIHKTDKNPTLVNNIEKMEDLGVYLFNSKPDIPIKKYHGLVFSEDVIEFEEKDRRAKIEYMGSKPEDKNLLKYQDYARAREYIMHNLQKEALNMNANAVIDMEFEYTNYNQQLPPDVVIAAYGTAVTIDEKFL